MKHTDHNGTFLLNFFKTTEQIEREKKAFPLKTGRIWDDAILTGPC